MVTENDLRQLDVEQLQEQWEIALKREGEAEAAYNIASGNVSGNPGGKMPSAPMRELQALDDEWQAAKAQRDAIERETARRPSE
jgi:hypothetical protein